MSKHTEGPWQCVAAEFGEAGTDNEGMVGFWVRMSEVVLCKADADLISAAPELLDALRTAFCAISGQNRDGTYRGSGIRFSDEERDQIEAAIAKAEGK